ncbi:hypothetical protein DVH24_010539 [Malus domestica]|uniref:Uncharacterized protein n=1 Tax=Malus domestica TaxID=3750 RepID=A0A498JWQ7_MALDO|nr:hypothetical protein DVH24_010539 [Malus domestica]
MGSSPRTAEEIFRDYSARRTDATSLPAMVKMEDAKPEVSASNNSNSESCDSCLLQDRFTYLCKMVFAIGRELLQASCKSVQRN